MFFECKPLHVLALILRQFISGLKRFFVVDNAMLYRLIQKRPPSLYDNKPCILNENKISSDLNHILDNKKKHALQPLSIVYIFSLWMFSWNINERLAVDKEKIKSIMYRFKMNSVTQHIVRGSKTCFKAPKTFGEDLRWYLYGFFSPRNVKVSPSRLKPYMYLQSNFFE